MLYVDMLKGQCDKHAHYVVHSKQSVVDQFIVFGKSQYGSLDPLVLAYTVLLELVM